jgi:hypothetical protein
MDAPGQSRIAVEIVEAVPVVASPRPAGALDRLEPGAQYVHQGGAPAAQREVVRQVSDVSVEELQQGIETICAAVSAAMAKLSPDNASAEFSLGFKAGLKVPVLMSGEANAALKVTLSWKRQA